MSSGGALALEAAARGVAITKLALYEPPFAAGESSFEAPDDFLERLTWLNSAGRPGDAVEYFLTAGLGMPGEMVAEMRRTPVWPGFEAVAHTLVYDTVLMDGQDALLAERAPTVTAPVLLLDGGSEPAVGGRGGGCAGRDPPACRAPHAGGPDARRGLRRTGTGSRGVLRRAGARVAVGPASGGNRRDAPH